MKIAFFEVKDWEKDIILDYAQKLEADVYFDEIEENIESAKEYEILSTFIYSDLSEKILKKLPNLKMIATRSTGFDHIDLEYCSANNIAVCSVPSYGEHTVAEHAFALILALSRKIVEGAQRVQQGGFSPVGLTGFDLKDKTLAVIGIGNIGKWMVRYAKAFNMNVLGVTRSRDKKEEEKLGYTWCNLDLALKEADIVSLHLPYFPSTHHLINRDNIKNMKPGSLLINTSRGPIVETEAILWALEEGILGGAGLDVLEEEEKLDKPWGLFDKFISKDDLQELVTAHVLREKRNVIITPHNAFNTIEAVERIVQTTYENISSFLKDKPTNLVSK